MATPVIGGGFGPFAAQVRFFRRKVNVPTAAWRDLWREEHAHGFMVAGAFKVDLVADLREIVERAQAGRTPNEPALSYDQFRRQFRAIVERHGWEPRGGAAWRAGVVYDTNVRQAFNAGRFERLTSPDMLKVRPFWQYRHNDKGISRRPRPLHQSWNGLVLRHDHPWWRTHYPMNGWGCKCGVRALSQRDLERLGKAGPDEAPADGTFSWTDKNTGEVFEIPQGVDPGFDYNVGAASRSLPSANRFGETVMRLPGPWRDRALDDAQRRAGDWFRGFGPMVTRTLAQDFHRGEVQALGFLSATVLRALEAGGSFPPVAVRSPLLIASDADIGHLLRASKRAAQKALPADVVRDLPQLLAQPDAVFYDTENPALVYARRLPDGSVAKVVVALGFRAKRSTAMRGELANWVRSGGIVDASNLTPPEFLLLEGAL